MDLAPLDLLAERAASAVPAIESQDTTIDAPELRAHVEAAARRLLGLRVECVALYADNGLDWVITDLACRQAGIRIPIIIVTVPQKPVKTGEGMGITEVLSMPFSGYELMNALNRSSASYRATAPSARVPAPKGR